MIQINLIYNKEKNILEKMRNQLQPLKVWHKLFWNNFKKRDYFNY